MWPFLLACTVDCDPGFEARGNNCYPAAEADTRLENLLVEALQSPLPDPLSVVDRYQEWAKTGTENCPSAIDGLWDTAGCTTEDGVDFAGKVVAIQVLDPTPEIGQDELGISLMTAATIREGERSLILGGIVSYHASKQASGHTILAAVTGDFFETPDVEPWMADGLGQSLYITLDSHTGTLQLDGGISQATSHLYFDQVDVVDGCPQGSVLVLDPLTQDWTELTWICECGTVDDGPLKGQEVCAPLAERAADLSATLSAGLP